METPTDASTPLMQYTDPRIQTAEKWYREDTERDILDADGWPRTSEGAHMWWKKDISRNEYLRRRYLCTVGSYGSIGHKSPFPNPDDEDKGYWPEPSILQPTVLSHLLEAAKEAIESAEEDTQPEEEEWFTVKVEPDPEKFDGNRHEVTIRYHNDRYSDVNLMVIMGWHLDELIEALEDARDLISSDHPVDCRFCKKQKTQ